MADDICFNGLPDLDFDAAAHYGIKDQKWGIRNYQYENGSYTPAGRERYRRGNGERRGGYSGNRREPYSQRQEEPKKSLKERFVARAKAEPGIIARNIVKKHIPVFALKDDELKNINERLALEESVLHLSGRLSPRDHRTTTHSVFTGILGAGVHTLDAFSVGAAKAFWDITSKAATSKGKGGDHKSSQDQKHDDSNRKKKDASHDGLDEGVNFTGLPDLDENSLEHWGIMGMKWGLRRWQNHDGTLTQAGKERYYSGKNQKGTRLANALRYDDNGNFGRLDPSVKDQKRAYYSAKNEVVRAAIATLKGKKVKPGTKEYKAALKTVMNDLLGELGDQQLFTSKAGQIGGGVLGVAGGLLGPIGTGVVASIAGSEIIGRLDKNKIVKKRKDWLAEDIDLVNKYYPDLSPENNPPLRDAFKHGSQDEGVIFTGLPDLVEDTISGY